MRAYHSDLCDSAGKIIKYRSEDFIANQFYRRRIYKIDFKNINNCLKAYESIQKFKPLFIKSGYLNDLKISRSISIMIKVIKK